MRNRRRGGIRRSGSCRLGCCRRCSAWAAALDRAGSTLQAGLIGFHILCVALSMLLTAMLQSNRMRPPTQRLLSARPSSFSRPRPGQFRFELIRFPDKSASNQFDATLHCWKGCFAYSGADDGIRLPCPPAAESEAARWKSTGPPRFSFTLFQSHRSAREFTRRRKWAGTVRSAGRKSARSQQKAGSAGTAERHAPRR